MKWRRNRQRQSPFRPSRFGQNTSPLNGLTMPGNNHLRRRIKIDRFDDRGFAVRLRVGAGLVADRQYCGILKAQNSRHGPRPDRNRILHCASANPDQSNGICQVQRACRHQRRVLTEAMSSNRCRLGPTCSAPGGKRSATRNQHRGLSVGR